MEFSDRVSAYPNRYLMTDENGNTSYVILERADEPTRVGTPLNAETFNGMLDEISQSTAAKNHNHKGVYSYGALRTFDSGALDAGTTTYTINSDSEKFYFVYILGVEYASTTVCIDFKMLGRKAITYCIYNPGTKGIELGQIHVRREGSNVIFTLVSDYSLHSIQHVCGYI